MLGTILTTLLALAPVQDEVPPENRPPTEEVVESTVTALEQELERALEGASGEALLEAVRVAARVPHEDVAEALAEVAVAFELGEAATTALDALGRLGHAAGCTELMALHKRHRRKLEERVDWAVELMRSLGRSGDERALDVLGKDPLDGRQLGIERARILALGKIRHPAALETLVGLYNRVPLVRLDKYSDQVRASFMALTGERLEGGRAALLRWWNDHKRNLRLPAEESRLEPAELRREWERFWGVADEDRPRPEGDGTRGD